MKRFLIALTVIASIVASCSKNEAESVNPDVNEGSYTIKALMADSSRTSISDDATMSWVTGDKISIYDGDFEEFTLKGEASGAEASFTGELYYPEKANLAVCPHGIGGEVADEMLTINMPVSYAYDGQSTHAPMIATGFKINDKEATIKFKHLGGLFKVTYNNVPDEAKFFCFESDNKQIAGELYIENFTVANPVIEVGSDPKDGNIVSYTIGESDDHSSMSFYVPVPVGTFDFNISLRDSENNKIAKSSKTKRGFIINRGDYVNIPAVSMPKTLTENFTANVDDTQYSSSKAFATADNIKTYDYAWSLTSGSTATVGHDFVKTGRSGNAGSIENSTMLAKISAGTVFTVKVYAANWPAKSTNVSVEYNGKNYSKALTTAPTDADNDYNASDFAEYEFVFQKAADVNKFVVGGTSERVLIDKIVIVEGGELPVEPKEFGVSTTSISAAWDDTEKTFDIVAADEVNWEIVADDGITLSSDEGNGNATITVTFAENTSEDQLRKDIVVSTNYSHVTGDSNYTIVLTQAGKPSRQMDGEGTVESPYSVADALYLADNLADNDSTSECYVTGTIKKLGTFRNGTYSYTIGTGDDTFEVYKGKDLGNANFSSEEDIATDQTVVIYGKIKKYVSEGNTTLEMDENNYLYSINGATSVLKSIAVRGQKTSFTQNEEWSFGGTVTASYRGKVDTDVTSNATFTGYNTANTGEQTVTASYTENNVTKTVDYTISVVAEGSVQITKVTATSQFTPGTYIILTYDEVSYVPNATSTNTGPSIGTVTKSEGIINITRDMVWTATAGSTDGTLKFESYANAGYYLTGSSSNGGVRVKTNPGTAGDWTPSLNNVYGVIATATGSGTRYLATYGTTDWRNYQSVSATNKAANFFKVVGWEDPGVPKHTLTINQPENGTIAATVDGESVSSGAEVEEGKTVEIIATPADGFAFDQWNVTGATVGTSSTETFKMSSSDVTINATFKAQSGPTPTTVSVTLSSKGYSNGAVVSNVTLDSNVTATFAKGTGSNDPKYYTSGTAVRCYGGNTITINAGSKTITGITLTYGSSDGSNAITASPGTFSTPSWTGTSSSVVFTIGGSSGNRRIAGIEVTYQ